MTRLLDTTSALAHSPLEASQVVAGSPSTGSRSLSEVSGAEVGIWEITPGTSTDTEVDEVFVVLSGSATIEFEDGEVLPVAAGSVVRLLAGDRTTWTVHETLRKVYVA